VCPNSCHCAGVAVHVACVAVGVAISGLDGVARLEAGVAGIVAVVAVILGGVPGIGAHVIASRVAVCVCRCGHCLGSIWHRHR
jgi:hypothetical protein